MISATWRFTPMAVLALAGLGFVRPAAAQPPEGDQFQVNTFTPLVQETPVVSSEGTNGFVVVWESYLSPEMDFEWSVLARRYENGVPVGGDLQVNAYTTDIQVEPAVAEDGAGGFVVAWRSYGSFGSDTSFSSIQARHFPADGLPGGEFQVNSYTTQEQIYPAVSPSGSGFVVVWSSRRSADSDDDWGIRARLFDGGGSPLADEFQVNTHVAGTQAWPSVAAAGEGFVVAWESEGSPSGELDSAVLAQRFAADGTPLGGEFQVNGYTPGDQGKPAVGAFPGGFVVVWTSEGSYGSDTDETSVQARLYDADGKPLGGEFQVNTYTTARQFFPAVNADGADGLVVVWRSEGSHDSDNDESSVQARRYSAQGVPLGEPFQVNSFTTSRQAHPGIAPDRAGGFVVVWYSDGSYGSDSDVWSIQGQRYGVALFEDGFESGDTSRWSATLP